MTNELIDTKQVEQHFEKANMAAEQVERGAAMAVTGAIAAGISLIEAKALVPHGEWSIWLGKNWDYSQPKASRYMTIASNYSCVNNLKDAESINEALRMIAEDKPETAPRSARKPADVVVTTPSDSSEPEPDADPAPDPPTIRTTPAGTTKVSEDKKLRTQQVAVEIVDDEPEEDPFAFATADECIRIAEAKVPPDDPKAAKSFAKLCRKTADIWDPPTKFRKPELHDVTAYFKELKSAAFEDFYDYYESNGWLVGRVAMKDWKSAARKWARTNGSNGNGTHQRTGKRGLTADEVFS